MSLNTGNAILSNAITVDGSYNVGIGGAAEAGWILKSTGNTKISSGSGTTVLQVNDTSTGGKAWSLISAGAGNAHSVAAGTFYLRNSSDGSNALTIASTGAATFSSSVTATSESTSSSLIQHWAYSTLPNQYNLKLNTIVSSGLVKYSFDLRNNNIDYPNNLVLTNGNVGIGTSSPQMPLSVQANTGNGAIRLIGTSNASSNNAGIYWYDSNDSTFNGYLGNFSTSFDIYNQRSTPMAFYTAGTERMIINSTGALSIKNGTQPTGNGLHSYFTSDVGYIDSLEANVAWRNLRLAGNDIIFWGAGTEKMRLSTSGNLQVQGQVYRYSGQTVVGGSFTNLTSIDLSSSRTYLISMIPTNVEATLAYRIFGVIQANATSATYTFVSLVSQTMDVTFSGTTVQARVTNGQQWTFNWTITQLL